MALDPKIKKPNKPIPSHLRSALHKLLKGHTGLALSEDGIGGEDNGSGAEFEIFWERQGGCEDGVGIGVDD